MDFCKFSYCDQLNCTASNILSSFPEIEIQYVSSLVFREVDLNVEVVEKKKTFPVKLHTTPSESTLGMS